AGVLRSERPHVPQGCVEVILVASVVDDPEAGYAVGLDGASTIAVDDVVDDQRRRCVGAEVEDDAIAIGVVAGTIVFPGDDVVRSDVVKTRIGVEPGDVVVGDGTSPTVKISIVVDEVVVAGQV